MRIFNQDTLKFEEAESSIFMSVDLNVASLYGLSQDREFDKKLELYFKDTNLIDKEIPLIFDVVGNFGILEKLGDKEEVEAFYIKIGSIVMSHFFEKDEDGNKIRTNHEYRLSVPKHMSALALSELVKRDMVNYKMRAPKLAIRFKDNKTHEPVFHTMREVE